MDSCPGRGSRRGRASGRARPPRRRGSGRRRRRAARSRCHRNGGASSRRRSKRQGRRDRSRRRHPTTAWTSSRPSATRPTHPGTRLSTRTRSSRTSCTAAARSPPANCPTTTSYSFRDAPPQVWTTTWVISILPQIEQSALFSLWNPAQNYGVTTQRQVTTTRAFKRHHQTHNAGGSDQAHST